MKTKNMYYIGTKKDLLEALRNKYITNESYKELCNIHGKRYVQKIQVRMM